MKSIVNVAAAAILFACVQGGSPATAQSRGPVQARVRTADLDLRTPAGVARLRQRIRFATEAACAAESPDLPTRRDADVCRGEMRQSGETLIAAATGAQPTRLATADSVTGR